MFKIFRFFPKRCDTYQAQFLNFLKKVIHAVDLIEIVSYRLPIQSGKIVTNVLYICKHLLLYKHKRVFNKFGNFLDPGVTRSLQTGFWASNAINLSWQQQLVE